MAVDMEALMLLAKDLLLAIGEDPERDGLKDTPERFAKWWKEFIDYDPGKTETSFNVQNTDQIVTISGIKVWSLCEHHLLPFSCNIAIGYIPANNKVLGLSKFGRIAHQMAHKPQVQERLANEIADEITRITDSTNVAVIADGEHLCMTMRGIKSPSTMSTSVMRGVFRDEIETRNELLFLVRR